MAATISHLNLSHAVIRWNLHKVSAASPSATALFSRQVFSNNITFPFIFYQISSKLRVFATSADHKCHAITTLCKNNSTSSLSSYCYSDLLEEDCDASFIDDHHVENSKFNASTSSSSIFGDNNVVNMQIMLSRFLKSFLLYGVIAVMTVAMALCCQNSAFAASYGRMGGSSSSSSKSSSSGGSSSYRSSGGSSSYKSSSSSSPSYKSSSRISSYLSSSKPSNYPSWSSATTPTCICNCHKEDNNKTLTPNSCTDCDCSEEGSKVQNPKKSKAPLIILASAALGAIAKLISGGGGPGSVLMVQVGISDKERVLQKKLNKIADSADTSTVDGLN